MRRLLLLLSIGAVGCAAANAERKLREDEREILALAERAEIYWEAMRWGDLDTAAGFYESQEDRLSWLGREGSAETYRYRSADVLRAEVGDEREAPEDGRLREGIVIVQIQGYEMPAQILEVKVVNQPWYRTEAGWFVDSSAE